MTLSWEHAGITPEKAKRLQEELRQKVVLKKGWETLSVIGAVDCSHKAGEAMGVAGIVLYRYPDLVELSRTAIEHPVDFPYVPGLLAFRELPLILAAIESLSQLPDVFLVDGQGIAHPRRMGIATHLGVVLDRPTIGCAKSILVGQAPSPPQERGAWTPLKDKGETVGALFRSRPRTQPLVVSPGHLVDLESALEVVQTCCDGTRIPKPLREADRLVRERLKSAVSGSLSPGPAGR